MDDNRNALRWERIGCLFQFPMIAAYSALFIIFRNEHPSSLSFLNLPLDVGVVLFVWCLVNLYVFGARLKGLITSGPYRFTRHPMYLGMLLTNICYWVQVSVWTSPLFLSLEVIFISGLIVAGYCQEKETLERFGQQATDYYKRTPRIPFARW